MSPLRQNDVLASNLLFAALAITVSEQLFWSALSHFYLPEVPEPRWFGLSRWLLPLVLLKASFYYAIRRGMFRAKVVALVCAYLAYADTQLQVGYVAGVAFNDLLGYPLLVLLKNLLVLAALVLMFRKPRRLAGIL